MVFKFKYKGYKLFYTLHTINKQKEALTEIDTLDSTLTKLT